MIQFTSVVDSAQPAAPMAGAPRCPNVNIHVRGTFNVKPRRFSAIITRGSDTAVV